MTDLCFSWDWRAQPPMERIAEAVNATPGAVMQLLDTGGDTYAVTVASRELTHEEQMRLYRS